MIGAGVQVVHDLRIHPGIERRAGDDLPDVPRRRYSVLHSRAPGRRVRLPG